MKVKPPDPNGFVLYVRARAKGPNKNKPIGNGRMIERLACRWNLSAETARTILVGEGWKLQPTPSGALMEWRPPSI